MPKLLFEKLLHDNNSVNVSVYKPDGISSFWNWFTRKNKTGDIPKTVFDTSYRLKLNENDLNMLKSIDLQKLMATRNRKKFPNQHKIFFLPKTSSLGSKEKEFLDNFALHMKQKTFQTGTKTFEQKVKSTSLFSIKSNHSLKYIHKIKSQRSIVHSVSSNRATCRVGNTARGPRNVLLKSVPPAVLESNLQNKVFLPLYVGKRKTDKDRTQKNKPAENICKHDNEKNESDVIPMLLTKIKSMEEQISDIENKTKQIDEVVSQQQILKTSTYNNKTGTAEKSIGVETKHLATHKVYPKNINSCSKKSKTCPTKLKNKRKLNYASGNSLKSTKKTKDLSVKIVNNTCDKNKTKKRNATDNLFNNPETFIGLHNFTIPNIMSKKNLFQANPNVGCDMILQLLKTFSEVSGSSKMGHTEPVKPDNLNLNNESSFVGSKTISNFSKPTFDWKHKSLTSASESQDEEINKTNTGISNIGVRKNYSFPLRNEVTKKDLSQVSKILEGSDQKKNIIRESFEQKTGSCHITSQEKIKVSEEKDISEPITSGLGKTPKQNNNEIQKLLETVKRNQDFSENNFDLEETKGSERSDELVFEKHLEFQICKNKSVQLDVKDLNISKTVLEQCSNAVLSHVESNVYIEQPMNKMSGITMEPCKLCSVHIKQSEMSTGLINPTENLSNRL
ncbi:uncharacterized protein LOC124355213 [Homalodisca vitripennis]|uniref:uncharacterized protein LOC124355213 n=1 Tax=Homalodisca vitripennis TaxID=197043 RepID=UPI001EEA1A84|nr:uncharacterized protein LOC124355213 [Homalodisca vitripennis]KAG8327351.1 hypothetical protein J6590_022776 [Homalodisca vitripennis]